MTLSTVSWSKVQVARKRKGAWAATLCVVRFLRVPPHYQCLKPVALCRLPLRLRLRGRGIH